MVREGVAIRLDRSTMRKCDFFPFGSPKKRGNWSQMWQKHIYAFGGGFRQEPTEGERTFAGGDTGGEHQQQVRGAFHGPTRR